MAHRYIPPIAIEDPEGLFPGATFLGEADAFLVYSNITNGEIRVFDRDAGAEPVNAIPDFPRFWLDGDALMDGDTSRCIPIAFVAEAA